MIANLALGTSLGCSLVTDSGGAETRNVAPRAGGSNCETQEGPAGEVCATCTDPDGSATTMCVPSDCYVQTEPDGAVCTTCTDIHGSKKTVCEDAPPKDCASEVQGVGLLCTTCSQDGQSETTCSPAECHVSNGCLECEDPRGNTGTDCSLDYESMDTLGHTFSSGDTFNSYTTFWGAPSGSATSCHYPGIDSCTITEFPHAQARCIDCRHPNGSGSNACVFDNDPLPDPFAGRPDDLPAPGTCVDQTSADGPVTCTTCTRQDLSATTTCRHPAAESCDTFNIDWTLCMHCTHADGTSVAFCDPLTL